MSLVITSCSALLVGPMAHVLFIPLELVDEAFFCFYLRAPRGTEPHVVLNDSGCTDNTIYTT